MRSYLLHCVTRDVQCQACGWIVQGAFLGRWLSCSGDGLVLEVGYVSVS